ncbi:MULTISPECIES: site-specific integrase [Streptomyces]|uniref:Integrase n=3 Tax=Streptomyces rimosus TaxID=1927 RepID=L8F3P7_STRR1|nr:MULTISPECIES: hypothetical protein [Streptomyces]KOG73139.1 hypothetical protein ADK78_18000 [Kitasatospora aureofaciens]MYT41993.1 hypothetical protein [Streptomyces sp. SID5471]KEF04917.1 hypothetical protein DF17_22020 [Streptomyces rimosus]KOT38681.1 hypothetical protein ADK42_17275 [Streptomyces rimosus subsp. rimosus]KOT38780.1 hypothetical protein ADK84_16520 [Streptomyces sp. NRRL WC-3701]
MSSTGVSARSCELCLLWAVMHWSRVCPGCKAWKTTCPQRGRCPRCRHAAHLNTDGLCKPCLYAIRAEDDAEWALALPGTRPRDLQLLVGLVREYANTARPLARGRSGGRRVGEEWRRKLKMQRESGHPEPPAVLEPQMWGQLPLFTVPRTLTQATVSAIVGRTVSGWEQAKPVLVEMAAEHGLSAGWHFKVAEMVRLALAVREAEGARLLPEALLRDLPANGDAVRLVLLRVGLLAPAPAPLRFSRTDQPARTPYITSPAPIAPRGPRQCRDCHAWISGDQRAGFRCDPCRHWRELHSAGRCKRCGADGLPLRGGRRRSCHPYRLLDAARPGTSRATQLVIALPAGVGGPVLPFAVDQPPAGPEPYVPAWHVSCGQEALFTWRRDWSPVLAQLRRRAPEEVPLTEAAGQLVQEFAQRRRHGQSPDNRKGIRTLTTLVYWLGADLVISERDVHDLAQLDRNLSAKPVCQFLRAHGLLRDDPELHQDADSAWIDTFVASLPGALASEVRTWVADLRSQGRREGEPRGYEGIRRYLTAVQPTLTAWAGAGVTTLREISHDQVETAVENLSGHGRRQLAICLRSLFRALKRKKVIFRNPARNLPVGDLKGIPRSVPSDRLTGLLDRAKTPLGRLVIALVAVHALPGTDIRTILTTDLNLARGTLEIRRGLLRHTLYLEELTHRLASEWLTYRYHRWPASTNPHLLVSQKTALDTDQPAVSVSLLRLDLPKGLTLDGLRQDRILNEASETGDPLKLMRLFGITEQTAMRYVTAAHPERTAKLAR